MIYGITFLLIITVYLQVNKLIEQEELRELKFYLIIMAIAILYSYGTLLEWNLPRPGSIITKIYQPISNYIFIKQK
ncbi:hypothetical protein BX659_103116 [Orenia metallireducens]|uniref:Uncharacterized protein n=1 Tax=Orenia metallireducens TaxID=1413210 RepID=A0A285FMK5_9FIRM|nr:hypothetical protein [Orenia metallireducens]PRX33589.1 hypothetical protein BX659_103116 [Orenia metallireducens]SNY11461.1 hypothetical protein SAMN06265827_102116 [Orenia metallireducens]